jgi:hypothetical protein
MLIVFEKTAPSWERRRPAGNVVRINEAFALKMHGMTYLYSFPFIHAEKGRTIAKAMRYLPFRLICFPHCRRDA